MKFFVLCLILVFSFKNAEAKAPKVFNYKTGKYLKKSDLTPEMFQEDIRINSEMDSKSHVMSINIERDEPQMDEIKSTFDSGYNVTGGYTSYISSPCHYTQLKEVMNAPVTYTSDMAINLQKWVDTCQRELSRFQTNPLMSLLNFTLVQYPLEQNSRLQNLTFTYDENHLKVRALMAIKDHKKRPLVIFRNGVYGDATESTVSKNFIMQVFDESPFHMLFLGNLTGEQFIRDNGMLAMGGFDEGRQFQEIIKQLIADDSPYKDLIEDIHVMGVSLGANGALFSSLYNSYVPEDISKIKSVTALCPVVNLENSLNHVFSNTILGAVYTQITYHLLKKVFKDVPVLAELLNYNDIWTRDEIANAIKGGAVRYYKDRTFKTPWDYAPFIGKRIESEQDFWDVNNFTTYADQVTTPTLVVHAKDDFIVPVDLNTKLLFEKLKNNKTNVGIVEVENGSHCAYNVANGWPTMSTLMREFILNHSSYRDNQELTENKLQYKRAPQNSSVEVFARYNWILDKKKSTAKLRMTYLDKWARSPNGMYVCRTGDYRYANGSVCYRSFDVDVKLSTFQGLNIRSPASDFEANTMSRWLNTHVTPTLEDGQIPYGMTKYPTHFKASGIFEQ